VLVIAGGCFALYKGMRRLPDAERDNIKKKSNRRELLPQNRCECFSFGRKESTEKLASGCSALKSEVHATGNRLLCCKLFQRGSPVYRWPAWLRVLFSVKTCTAMACRLFSRPGIIPFLSPSLIMPSEETKLLLAVLASTHIVICTGIRPVFRQQT
jgi:hypothetical protein